MRRKKEDADKTKEQLLEAALIVFKNLGYKAAKLDDIAKQANVTRGAIAWHFKTKENIYRVLLESINSTISEEMETLTGDKEPLQKIHQFFDLLIADRKQKHCRVIVMRNLIKVKPTEFSDLVKSVEDIFSFIQNKIKDAIGEGVEKKAFKTNIDINFMSRFIYTYWMGFLTDYEFLYSEYTDDELKESLLGYFNELLLIPDKN